ncbi:MAG: hypothetical protein M3Q33_02005 [Acidobacteriota bacterium]|nr:hypothetical protein [Acidobacteriota bacterium]
MIKFGKNIFLACGLLLTLAAFPVFAQKKAELNKKPLLDFVDLLNQKIANKKVDLTKPFSVEVKGVLTKEGKLNPKTAKFTKGKGNAEMIKIGKRFIEAINASGLFGYLSMLGVDKINFALSKDEKQVTAIIKTATATAERAKTTASGLKMLFQVAQMQTKDEDDKLLLSYFNVIANDKNFVINFVAPQEAIQKLVEKNLEKLPTKVSSK